MTKTHKIICTIIAVVVVFIGASAIRLFTRGLLNTATDSVGYGASMKEASYDTDSFSLGASQKASKGEYRERSENVVESDVQTERLIIKTGTFSLVVQDVELALESVMQFAKEKGGFIVSSYISPSQLSPSAEVTIRIPVNVFDSGVEEVKELGEVESERISGQDVTEEYVDLDAQLGNLRVTENQFFEIMKQAYKIEDILAVQRELTNVRRDIERIEGRMKYLRQSAQLSTLTIYLATDPDMLPVVDSEDKWKPLGVAKDAIRSLLVFGKGIVNLIIWVVVYIPLWILIGLVVMGVRRVLNRVNSK